MSFWSQGFRAGQINIDFWKLSLALARKHYKDVHLVTDIKGKELLKQLPFKSIRVDLEDLKDINSGKIWSLGKIYTYNKIADEGPFMHLDSDVFLWEKLPEDLLKSQIFAQSLDMPLYSDYNNLIFDRAYDLNFLKIISRGQIPQDWQELIISRKIIPIYNVGILGGQNFNFFKKYSEYSLEMVKDKRFKELFESEFHHSVYGDAVLANSCCLEQLNLSLFNSKNDNLFISTLLKDMQDSDNRSFKKYTHLLRAKNNQTVIDSIRMRVKSEPYILDIDQSVSLKTWRGERDSLS